MFPPAPGEPAGAPGAPTGPVAGGRGAAFFDLDKTLMQGSSAFQFARAVRAAGLISRRQLVGDALANLKFRLRGATDAETDLLRDRIAASVRGVRVRDFERLGLPVLIRVLPRIYPEMLDIAHAHQDAGRDVYIITAASEELAQVLARVLALDGGIGSHFSDQVDGIYTGQSDGPFMYGEMKATEIRRLAAERGYDLSQSYAYSDSVSDVPMLSAVGHAVVVSPDRALAEQARDHGWQTLRLDPLGRRLKVIGGLALAVGVGRGLRILTPSLSGVARRFGWAPVRLDRLAWATRLSGLADGPRDAVRRAGPIPAPRRLAGWPGRRPVSADQHRVRRPTDWSVNR
ncbi:HAD family phosphatase [Conexibacter sp. DBS9H8]|uniref:HAD family hydrolase n=1 Tax=Conexibacter sp. DBS9H8 TaxID=2937801 RepID=UPI00200CCA40|nr:HAD family hydrolase [Conexibacter sp. DBS9H8]